MTEKKEKLPRDVLIHIGSGIGIAAPDWTWTTINPNNPIQTKVCYELAKKLETQPIVPPELREKMLWLDDETRNHLLKTWRERRNAMLDWCYRRINPRILRELKEKGEVE